MVIHKQNEFEWGYTPVASLDGLHCEILVEPRILKLRRSESYHCSLARERTWLLFKDEVTFSLHDGSAIVQRGSCVNKAPIALHAPSSIQIEIQAEKDYEIDIERCKNDQAFPVKFNGENDVNSEVFGADILQEARNRTVRNVFDGATAPYSYMNIGEFVNHPARGSSYPPHDRPTLEFNHYRFFPKQGLGLSVFDEDAYVVHHGDTALVVLNTTHSQCAGPG